jgi:hypothetical protein
MTSRRGKNVVRSATSWSSAVMEVTSRWRVYSPMTRARRQAFLADLEHLGVVVYHATMKAISMLIHMESRTLTLRSREKILWTTSLMNQ